MDIKPLEILSPADYQATARALADQPGNARAVRMALLSSNSFAFLAPYLKVESARRGMDANIHCPEFGQVEQALLSDKHCADLDLIVIAMRVEDLAADASARATAGEFAAIVDDCVERIVAAARLARKTSSANILVANLEPVPVNANIFDAGFEAGKSAAITAANRQLAARLTDIGGVHIWDYAGLVTACGMATWRDARLWYLARQPIASAHLPHAAAHLARNIAGVIFAPAKCVVVDLDNTIWGGAAGDEGLDGIQIGDDYPGNVYKDFQRTLAGLRAEGILLAIASKNDVSVARRMLDEHPDQLLGWDDFSSHQVGWGAKSESVRRVAEELNIGLDSLVFFDDNPVEREEVRQNAPSVRVVPVPKSPADYPRALLEGGYFDNPLRSAEDAERGRYYEQESRREAARSEHGSMEDFLSSLEMTASLGRIGPETSGRIAQLIGKTNQFNLTTRRHSQQSLTRMAEDPNYETRWTRLADRYGDSGLIGVVILKFESDIAEIDSFLMSCRVMNRQVELAMLCDAAERAMARGCQVLRGVYRTSARNGIVENFYADNGFTRVSDEDFELSLTSGTDLLPAWPAVIERLR